MIVLETERLLFRDHEVDDLDPFCAMEADPEVRRFVGGKPRTREQAEEKFRRVYLPPVRNRRALWATVFSRKAVASATAASIPLTGKRRCARFLSRQTLLGTRACDRGGPRIYQVRVRRARVDANHLERRDRKRCVGPRSRKTRLRVGAPREGEPRSFDHFELRA